MAEKKIKVGKAEGAKKSGKTCGFRKKLASPVVTVALFAVAAAMLLTSTIGGTRAALTYQSEDYIAQVALDHIGVTLLENGNEISWRYYTRESDTQYKLITETGRLLTNMLQEGENLQLGKKYKEELAVVNSGGIDEYVRVTIYKYWLPAENTSLAQGEGEQEDPDENESGRKRPKMQELDPNLIHLNLVNPEVWLKDTEASGSEGSGAYKERTVLYYKDILKMGEMTEPFCDSLTIDREIASKVREEVTTDGKYTTIKTIYAYDGVEFVVEVEVDAVQDHNAQDAILSAWGRRVEIENGSLAGSNGILKSVSATAPANPAEGE